MFSIIMMTCGYIESAQTSWLIFGTEYFENPGFETRGKAITELDTRLIVTIMAHNQK